MRVVSLESPWKGHQPLYAFDFLILILNIWEEFKVLSRFKQKWIQPPACCLESFLPIGCRPFICWKNPPKWCSILVWIADCWFSSNILFTSRNPESICWLSRIFGSTVRRKRSRFVHIQPVIPTSGKIRGIFVWSGKNTGYHIFCWYLESHWSRIRIRKSVVQIPGSGFVSYRYQDVTAPQHWFPVKRGQCFGRFFI